MKTVRIDKGRIIPVTFCFVATLGIVLIYGLLYRYLNHFGFIIFGMLLSPSLPLIWASRTIIEINPAERYISNFSWLMGIRVGQKVPFQELEKIYVNEVPMAQRLNSYSGNSHVDRFSEFVGFLKVSTGETHELCRRRDRVYVVEQLQKIAKKLDTEFVDNTVARAAS